MSQHKLNFAMLLLCMAAVSGTPMGVPAQVRDSVAAGTLPTPTGPYAIGIAHMELVDSSRPEWAPDRSGMPRRIPLTVIYPALPNGDPPAPYLAEAAVLAEHQLLGPNSQRLAESIVRTAKQDALPARNSTGFPVVIFSPGRGERAAWYTAMHEELASHGVVVVTIAHAGMADVVLGDGTLIRHYPTIWDPKPVGWDAGLDSTTSVALRRAVYDSFYVAAANYLHGDMERVLDYLSVAEGMKLGGQGTIVIDTGAVIAGGHSYGANVSVEACHRDGRVRGCFSLDGGSFGEVREVGLRRPYLVIRPAFENDRYPRGVAQDQLLGSMRTWAWEVNVTGANHRSFMDAPFWVTRAVADDAATRIAMTTTDVIRSFVLAVQIAPADPALLLDSAVGKVPGVIARTLVVRGGQLWR